MQTKRQISVRLLRRLIDYNPLTGEMYWKPRPAWMFSKSGAGGRTGNCGRWNGHYAGRPAFTATQPLRAYKVGRIFDRIFLAHRIAFALHHGRWPNQVIDHINGIQDDNRAENLRDVSQLENVRNSVNRRRGESSRERATHAI